jgi:hypothetical protein
MNHQSSLETKPDAPLPRPLMLALAKNMHAMQEYARLSDAGRERLVELSRTATSQEEVAALLQNLRQFS